ncbi:MAG: MFS transporter [Actinobacteria bacterium]|nr:MAG: MFS transporter [Actinomycetota bacterium]
MSADATSLPLTSTSASAPVARAAHRWAGLVVVCLGMMMTFLNITQTVATLAPLQQDLHVSSADLVWVASVYSMVVASLVLSAGTLGDILGRRAVFAVGAAVLGAGSLVVFASSSALGVIAGQAIMGAGGALILPNSLAIVTHAFTDPHERTTAVSIWAAVSGIGLAIGPLTAGALLEVFSWHSVFLVNVVLAVAVLALTRVFVADSRHPDRRLDRPGLVLAILAIASLNYAVIEGGHGSLGDTKVVAAFVVAVIAGLAFVGVEARSRTPMLQLPLFRIPSFSAANAVAVVAQYGAVGIPIAQVLYFELVRHESILSTGLLLLPLMATYVIVSSVAARIVRRAGFKATISAGLLLSAAGTLLMLTQQPTTSFALTAVFLTVFGAGIGLILPPATAAAVISVPHREGGMASGTVNMFRQVGNTLGASITGTIVTSGLASRLPTQSFGDAFAGAMHTAVLVPGIAALVGAGAAVAFINARPAHR